MSFNTFEKPSTLFHSEDHTLAQAVSQHTDTSKNTQASLYCCHALHSYLGTVFRRDTDKLFALVQVRIKGFVQVVHLGSLHHSP